MSAHPDDRTSFLARLREDMALAVDRTIWTRFIGSDFVPRTVRRFVLNRAGAHALSSTGSGFELTGSPRFLTIGTGVYVNSDVQIQAIAPVTIGDYSAIGMQTLIATSDHPIDEDGHWSMSPVGRPVHIGSRVWIGGRVTILPGATIEDDVVVAAGAVVTGRLASWGVYGGVPAKRIRDLRPASRVGASSSEPGTAPTR
ncbi:DapH/DapD/GlmU-related protein [Curtobacterium sp. ISL-83]|uniref:acyltransferase n=1 Tax=Curtobacterium sp. ISL-83 TaxID=2819145 RepID=UPI001BE6D48E|nr:acyltransferase [Curtobacterium sp. ISL-83]MBT2501037.1 acyltransferase [Curtobacterium sp. ISL-83]